MNHGNKGTTSCGAASPITFGCCGIVCRGMGAVVGVSLITAVWRGGRGGGRGYGSHSYQNTLPTSHQHSPFLHTSVNLESTYIKEETGGTILRDLLFYTQVGEEKRESRGRRGENNIRSLID